MKLYVSFNGKEQEVEIPNSKKTVSEALPLLEKVLKIEKGEIFQDNLKLSDEIELQNEDVIEVRARSGDAAPKEDEAEQYEVVYEYEEEEDGDADDGTDTDYEPSDSSYSD